LRAHLWKVCEFCRVDLAHVKDIGATARVGDDLFEAQNHVKVAAKGWFDASGITQQGVSCSGGNEEGASVHVRGRCLVPSYDNK